MKNDKAMGTSAVGAKNWVKQPANNATKNAPKNTANNAATKSAKQKTNNQVKISKQASRVIRSRFFGLKFVLGFSPRFWPQLHRVSTSMFSHTVPGCVWDQGTKLRDTSLHSPVCARGQCREFGRLDEGSHLLRREAVRVTPPPPPRPAMSQKNCISLPST